MARRARHELVAPIARARIHEDRIVVHLETERASSSNSRAKLSTAVPGNGNVCRCASDRLQPPTLFRSPRGASVETNPGAVARSVLHTSSVVDAEAKPLVLTGSRWVPSEPQKCSEIGLVDRSQNHTVSLHGVILAHPPSQSGPDSRRRRLQPAIGGSA